MVTSQCLGARIDPDSLGNTSYPDPDIFVPSRWGCIKSKILIFGFKAVCGSVTFGTDPDPRPLTTVMDPEPEPAIFVADLQEANKTMFFFLSFSTYYFLKVILNHSSKIKKVTKKSQNSRKDFLTIFA
jgi:hypothetical protein